jgi:pyrroline-5-carboxylate reductase
MAMSEQPLHDTSLAVIGAGVMGEAMLAGLVDRDLIDPARVTCSHPRPERRDALVAAHRVAVTADNVAAARGADIVLLAVKPQMLPGVMAELRGTLRADQLVISVIAGASTRAIGEGLDHPAVVRTMPNTPAQIGQGVTVWYATESVDERGRARVRAMLAALGREFEVHDERQVAMATAVSGTGPTYIFLFIEALTDAAVHLGFPRHVARELVLDTMSGSADFALQSGKHVAELRDMVTSPGGTSAEALYQLEKGGLRTVVSDAVWAAFERTLQLEARLEGREPAADTRRRG